MGSDDRSRAVAAGCLGTVVGGLLGCVGGGLLARHLGLQTTGSALFLAIDLLYAFCVGGGGIVGAIAGREVGTALARRRRRGNAGGPQPPAPSRPAGVAQPTAAESAPLKQPEAEQGRSDTT